MTILSKLASSLGRRDEAPNLALAKHIAETNDKKAVAELVQLLGDGSSDAQSDCIKVLYEVGEKTPALIAPYHKEFLALLGHKNNRLQWGAMTALHAMTPEIPKTIYDSLAKIMAAADKGSVITRDNAVGILIRLCSIKQYAANAFTLLNEQLLSCPANQLPMYAERALEIVTPANKKQFVQTLTARLNDIEKASKRTRVEKIIRKAG